MSMTPDDFRFYEKDPSEIPDLPFRPYPITIEDIQKLRSTLFTPPLGEQPCCTINTNNTEKVKKIKELVKKCTNLNVYIDGENVFKKILEICEGK